MRCELWEESRVSRSREARRQGRKTPNRMPLRESRTTLLLVPVVYEETLRSSALSYRGWAKSVSLGGQVDIELYLSPPYSPFRQKECRGV